MPTSQTFTDQVFSMLEDRGQAALNAQDPVSAMRELMQGCFETLGDRTAHLKPGALLEGERQYFVAGAFFVTPDRRYHMICGNVGFPPEQERLCIPIDGGHPGQVYASKDKKILKNTDEHGTFRQYLKSSRMGSTVFAPLIWQGQFIGQLIVAAQARNTMRDEDLQALVAVARLAASVWVAQGGPQWLTVNYPPENGFYVDREGVKD